MAPGLATNLGKAVLLIKAGQPKQIMRVFNQQVFVPAGAVNPQGIDAFTRSWDKKRKDIRNIPGQSKLSDPCWLRICATLLLPLLLLAWPAVLQAQFNYSTNNGRK